MWSSHLAAAQKDLRARLAADQPEDLARSRQTLELVHPGILEP